MFTKKVDSPAQSLASTPLDSRYYFWHSPRAISSKVSISWRPSGHLILLQLIAMNHLSARQNLCCFCTQTTRCLMFGRIYLMIIQTRSWHGLQCRFVNLGKFTVPINTLNNETFDVIHDGFDVIRLLFWRWHNLLAGLRCRSTMLASLSRASFFNNFGFNEVSLSCDGIVLKLSLSIYGVDQSTCLSFPLRLNSLSLSFDGFNFLLFSHLLKSSFFVFIFSFFFLNLLGL